MEAKRFSQTTFKTGDSIPTVYPQNEKRNQFIEPGTMLNESRHILNDNSSNFEAVNPQSKAANKDLTQYNLH